MIDTKQLFSYLSEQICDDTLIRSVFDQGYIYEIHQVCDQLQTVYYIALDNQGMYIALSENYGECLANAEQSLNFEHQVSNRLETNNQYFYSIDSTLLN